MSTRIELQIDTTNLKYYGSSGLHMYAISPTLRNGVKVVTLNHSCQALDLYKLHFDLATFLGNELHLSPTESKLSTYGIYGNPRHLSQLEVQKYNTPDLQIVGYADTQDVSDFLAFLTENGLSTQEGVENYFNRLDDEIKEELEIMLEDRIIEELFAYIEPMVEFFGLCVGQNNEVLIIANA